MSILFLATMGALGILTIATDRVGPFIIILSIVFAYGIANIG